MLHYFGLAAYCFTLKAAASYITPQDRCGDDDDGTLLARQARITNFAFFADFDRTYFSRAAGAIFSRFPTSRFYDGYAEPPAGDARYDKDALQ